MATTQPYTPAEGVNANIGPAAKLVQVRPYLLSRDEHGYPSASIVTQQRDAMIASWQAVEPQGTAGPPSPSPCLTRSEWARTD